MVNNIKVNDIFNNIKIINIYNGYRSNQKRKICDYLCLICNNIYYNKELRSIIKNNIHQCRSCSGLLRRKCDLSPLLYNYPLSWYYTGLLLADGTFSMNNRENINYFCIELNNKDEYYLKLFADFLKTEVHYSNRKNAHTQKSRNVCSIYGRSKDIIPKYTDKYDIKLRKTYNPPDIKKLNWSYKQKLSIAIGFIDGDGARNLYDGFYITNHKSWLEMHKYMFKDVACSSYINKNRGVISYINQNGFNILKNHAIKYKLPIFERKWFTRNK